MDLPTFEDLFKELKLNFWLMGIPYNKTGITIRYCVLFMSLMLILIEEIAFFVSRISAENILELANLAPCTCTGILSVLKIYLITYKKSDIFKLTKELRILYQEMYNDHKKREIVQKGILRVKSFIIYYFTLNLVLISVYNFFTLVYIPYVYLTTGELVFSLPYAIIVPFSTDRWSTWTIVYLHSIVSEWLEGFFKIPQGLVRVIQVTSTEIFVLLFYDCLLLEGFICVLYFATVDSLYCIMTHLVCSYFSVIANEIEHLNNVSLTDLKRIVARHQHILKLSDDLEDIFTGPNLYNVLVGSLVICALGFNLTAGEWARVPGFILFLTSVLAQILMMSVFGENLISESKKIGDAAFLCEWYEMDEKRKKIILILMTRSNKPNRLTAYKFSTICYRSFTKIISTSWSYFTILRTVYTPGNTVNSD